jgi:hypothetical protein
MKTLSRNQVYVLLLLALGGVVLLVIVAFALVITWMDERNHDAELQWSQKNLDDQVAAIRSGRTKSICFYCSTRTDALLEQLVNVADIEKVTLQLTDATDDGMKSLAALKKLKSLSLHGSRVGDRGFSYIKTMSSLEHLELTNTQVTDRSLPLLKDLPNLRSLALFREARLGPTFTEAGLADLKALTELKQLYICGGWASDAAIRDLQKALPNCTISTEEGDLVM